MEVPPSQDGSGEKDEAEDLIAAEGAEMGGAAGFGFAGVELWLGSVGHGTLSIILLFGAGQCGECAFHCVCESPEWISICNIGTWVA